MQSKDKDLFVAIWMVTYNQDIYILKSVESIMMQISDFNFKLFIGDDCSTDKTRQICKNLKEKYVDKIELVLNDQNIGSNLNAKNIYNLCYNSAAKYIALCEGDDYWTDPYKLQKQVDFLEKNQDYSICWTNYMIKDNNSNVLQQPSWNNIIKPNENFSIDLNNIFTPYCTYTLTSMFRKDCFDMEQFESHKYGKDNTLYALCLTKGKGMLLNFYSAVYRMHDGGIFSNASLFNKSYSNYLNFREIICKIPICNNENIRKMRNSSLVDSLALIPNKKTMLYHKLLYDSIIYLGFNSTSKIYFGQIKKFIKYRL